jgi:hypothetical protein
VGWFITREKYCLVVDKSNEQDWVVVTLQVAMAFKFQKKLKARNKLSNGLDWCGSEISVHLYP